jgi:Ca2+-binding RTX toxin-like protein
MKLRAALTVALVVPSVIGLTGPAGPAHAAAMCQGQPATIEGTYVDGTEGNDVIVATGDGKVDAKGGNDLICMDSGIVRTGLGDDSVVATGLSGYLVDVELTGGNDSFINTGTADSIVLVHELTSLHVQLANSRGNVWLYPTSTAGTGAVDFGAVGGRIVVLGEKSGVVDLVHGTASVDGIFNVTVAHAVDAIVTGARVRFTGDDQNNQIEVSGCHVSIKGGDGRDRVDLVGNRFDVELPTCHRPRSTIKGQAGPDHLHGGGGNDVLLGGQGDDVTDGRGGNDRCVAEDRRHCER